MNVTLERIAERLHERVHQGTCADMHPAIHAQHMIAFTKRARQIAGVGECQCQQ